MGNFKPQPGVGSAFHNKNKKTLAHPDFTGMINISNLTGGKDDMAEIALWEKKTANGNRYWFTKTKKIEKGDKKLGHETDVPFDM